MRINTAHCVSDPTKSGLTEVGIFLRLTILGSIIGGVLGAAIGFGLQALGISLDAANFIGGVAILCYGRQSGFFRIDKPRRPQDQLVFQPDSVVENQQPSHSS